MKLGIILVITGVILLIMAIPFSILGIIRGVTELEQGIVSGGISAYVLIIAVTAGFVMVVIGATRIYFRK